MTPKSYVDRETGGAVLDRKRDFYMLNQKTQYKISTEPGLLAQAGDS